MIELAINIIAECKLTGYPILMLTYLVHLPSAFLRNMNFRSAYYTGIQTCWQFEWL